MERLTEQQIKVLEKLARRTNMDCWFSIKNETSIYDLENQKTISLKNALEDFNDGIVDIQDYGLTKKEIEIYQNLIDDIFPKKEVGSRLHLEGDENKDSQEKGYMNKEMYKENLETLNTIDSFIEGFKIERDGKVFTLTPEEMSDFRYLEKARDGRNALSSWSVDMDLSEEEETLVETMMNDEELCYNITQDYENEVFSDTGSIEQEVVKKYIEKAVSNTHKYIEDLEDIKEKLGDMYSALMQEAIHEYAPYNKIVIFFDYHDINAFREQIMEEFVSLDMEDLRKHSFKENQENLLQKLEENNSDWLFEYTSDIEVNIQNKFNELATEYLDNGIIIDMQLPDVVSEMYGHFGVTFDNGFKELLETIKLNINLETQFKEEWNSDFSNIANLMIPIGKEFKGLDDSDKEIIENNCLTYLVNQQGYDITDLLDNKKDSPFIKSITEELENITGSMNVLTSLVKVDVNTALKLMSKNCPDIKLKKQTMLGLFDPWQGGGSTLGIDLAKSFVFTPNMIRNVQIEGVKNQGEYTVNEVYGLIDECWKETLSFITPTLALNEQEKVTEKPKISGLSHIQSLTPISEKKTNEKKVRTQKQER